MHREVEDIAALIAEAGGSPHLFGASSGGALALEAAAAGVAIDRLAVYEVPYQTVDNWPEHGARTSRSSPRCSPPAGAATRSRASCGSPRCRRTAIAAARGAPFWPELEALAPTLAYDAACLGDGRPPTDRLARITRPTLVATGVAARDAGAAAWIKALDPAADAIAAALERSERVVLEGQGHVPDPAVLVPVLTRFFAVHSDVRPGDSRECRRRRSSL